MQADEVSMAPADVDVLRKSIRGSGLKPPGMAAAATPSGIARPGGGSGAAPLGRMMTTGSRSGIMSNIERMGRGRVGA